jgi:hypothetical protein
MTGVADLYLYLKRPYSRERRKRLEAHFQTKKEGEATRFVVLSWKRTGSNLLCGILFNHPEITMHNELLNPIDIFSYYPTAFRPGPNQKRLWSVLTRDLFPIDFLEFIWSGTMASDDLTLVNPNFKAVGFKSFPDHWMDVRNEPVWQDYVCWRTCESKRLSCSARTSWQCMFP